MGPLLATYTNNPFSNEWHTVEALSDSFEQAYGSKENPFTHYSASIFYLLMLQQRMHEKWVDKHDEETKKLLLTVNQLLERIEEITDVIVEQTKTTVMHELHAELLAHLDKADAFIEKHAPRFLPHVYGNKNYAYQQPPTWPPPAWPPPTPQPESKWVVVSRVAGTIGTIGLIYYLLRDYFSSQLEKDVRRAQESLKESKVKHIELEKRLEARKSQQANLEVKYDVVLAQLASTKEMIGKKTKDIKSVISRVKG